MSSLIFLLILALVIFFIKQYNTLQKLTVEIKEARANIIVAYEKKVAIINQYSGLVDEYGDYEKSIQLKVSDNFLEMARATAKAVQNITALANQFPELKQILNMVNSWKRLVRMKLSFLINVKFIISK